MYTLYLWIKVTKCINVHHDSWPHKLVHWKINDLISWMSMLEAYEKHHLYEGFPKHLPIHLISVWSLPYGAFALTIKSLEIGRSTCSTAGFSSVVSNNIRPWLTACTSITALLHKLHCVINHPSHHQKLSTYGKRMSSGRFIATHRCKREHPFMQASHIGVLGFTTDWQSDTKTAFSLAHVLYF